MNPQTLYIFQILVNSGVAPQQAWTQAQQMAAQVAGPGGAASGAQGMLGQLMTLLGAGSATGIEGNVFGQQEQAAQTGLNPQATARGINQLTKPLSRQLINSVSRASAPGIEGAGLATSPGMSQQITAQALAPYELQEQQLGQSAFEAGQNRPFSVGSGAAGGYPSDVANLGYLMSIIGNQA
jgi:hypothetical protein